MKNYGLGAGQYGSALVHIGERGSFENLLSTPSASISTDRDSDARLHDNDDIL